MLRTLTLTLSLAASTALAGDVVTIKLGTLAPQGSSWHNILKQLAEDWSAASDGKVKLKVYAGGTQGSEGDMVRKMGVNTLQAASITDVGLHDLIEEPMVFSTPGMVDEQTVGPILSKVAPEMEQKLLAKNYVVLNWARVGTIYIFCTKPYKTPEAANDDAKFFAWDGDPGSIEAFKKVGWRPVVLASTDIVPSLQTGMINCVSQVPAYVLTGRLFEKANKMMDFPWSYLVGATVVKKDAWDKIPPDVQKKLIAAAQKRGKEIDDAAKKLNDDAIAEMKKQGLEVVHVDPVVWEKAAARSWPAIRGHTVPEKFFDQVVGLRKEVRGEK